MLRERHIRCNDCGSYTVNFPDPPTACGGCDSTNVEVLALHPRRVLVCGSRSWYDARAIRERLARLLPPHDRADEPTVVHGDARGADRLASEIALDLGLWVEAHPANWKLHGKAAGPIRNRRMLDTDIDLVIAFQRDSSRGTQDTINEAHRRGIPVEVHRG